MVATGGIAGEVAGGTAARLGAGEAGSAIIGASAAGAVGNVGGHFVGDAYDQLLNGKAGFDPLSSYGRSFAEGGIAAAVVAPLGLAAAKYLPEATRTMAQEASAAHPRMTRVLEAARMAGTNAAGSAAGAAVRLRMTVREFLESIGSGNGPPPGFRYTYAGAGGAAIPPRLTSAPPESSVWVTIRPLHDLNAPRPAQRLGDENDDLVEIERVEPEPGSLFDPRGEDNASLADGTGSTAEINDVRTELPDQYRDLSDHEGGISVRDARNSGAVPNEGAEPMERHHIFPQSAMEIALPDGGTVMVGGRAWFKDRGIDIDEFCVDLSDFDHDMIHGGNQSLASRHWREGEWRSAILDELHKAETDLQEASRDDALLSREDILQIGRRVMEQFDIADHPFVHFTKDPQP